MDISFGIDPASLLISMIAVYIALREIRLNRSVSLKLVEFIETGGTSVSENGGKLFNELRVVFRNRGIALHNVQVSLQFRGSDGHGWITFPLKKCANRGVQSEEFSCGMIAEFSLKSYELGNGLAVLLDLRNVWKQEPMIVVYSQSYLSHRWLISTTKERLIRTWNAIAWKVNALIPPKKLGPRSNGTQLVKRRASVPVFRSRSWPVECFLRELKAMEKKAA